MKSNDYWKGKRVFVTGHTGFKGSWLCHWLKRKGAVVHGYSKPQIEECILHGLLKNFGNDDQTFADIRDFNSLSNSLNSFKPEFIFHLAAQALVRSSYDDPLETWSTNLVGTANLLEAVKSLSVAKLSIVLVTSDKVYENREWDYPYREIDRLGGHDPYSASKAAKEILANSWNSSFFAKNYKHIRMATARSGNVIGGGDWANDRIVPDLIQSNINCRSLKLRNPYSTRPWQHVLEPLKGYLTLAQMLQDDKVPSGSSFNFGPSEESCTSVLNLVNIAFSVWPGKLELETQIVQRHEANKLSLSISKAAAELNWRPIWNFKTTVGRTINWYKLLHEGSNAIQLCDDDIALFERQIDKTEREVK
ncbi:CDP-glucose 4,6-dehydratase [Vibrio pectenicida]|uniref:CDP-glucose 4,6-dehydratase n=1 Tax=Vibrio pectenicida TaxID=62763 RepID=A0A3R9FXS2_9VIBR|nr:CDP-glucose 4,6-dehydratase [Vibrio pectenicida]RSD27582.1 CDP-glucose 4,6-dehydratase [Vibrio pectenicida]